MTALPSIATSREVERQPNSRAVGLIDWPRVTARCIAPPVCLDTQVGAKCVTWVGPSSSYPDPSLSRGSADKGVG